MHQFLAEGGSAVSMLVQYSLQSLRYRSLLSGIAAYLDMSVVNDCSNG